MITFVQYLVDGLGVGCLYVLVATGFTLVFGVMGIMNVAHAELYMIAVFTYLWVSTDAGLGLGLGVIAGVLAACVLGAVMFFGVLDRIHPSRPLALFTATLGVSYVLENSRTSSVNPSTTCRGLLNGSARFWRSQGVRACALSTSVPTTARPG